MCTGNVAENPVPYYRLIHKFRFLLASLNIEGILQEPTIHRRQERLSKIIGGLGLEDAYGATIERVNVQGGDKSRLGVGALMWITHAEQPLMAHELCYALAVELGFTDFNAGNIPSVMTLVSCCLGLITVDKEASTVRLIHFTLKKYLSAWPDIFSRPHSAIAEICLTYLNSRQVKALPAHYEYPPFLEYCSIYWGMHAKRKLSECARSLALELLQEYDDHMSANCLTVNISGEENESESSNFRFNGLHCASFFGIAEVVSALREM